MNSIRIAGRRPVLAALAAAVLAACGGSSKSSAPPVSTATNHAFTGALSTGEVLVVDVGTPPHLTGVSGPAGSVTVTGTLALAGGGSVVLTGYYVPGTGAIVIAGGAYELTGTFGGGSLSGTFTVSGTPVGAFFAADSTSAAPTTYCGTFEGTNNSDQGSFVLLVSGGTAFAAVEAGDGVTLSGTSSNGHVSLTTTGVTMDGTVTDAGAQGNWTHGADVGTWSATTAACPVPPAPPAPLDACNVSLDATEATTVAATKSTATMPALTGGAIPPGRYVLSAVTYYEEAYAGPDSFEERAIVEIDGSTFKLVGSSNNPSRVRISGTFGTSGGTLSFSGNTCLGPPSGSFSYVMSGGELWIQGSTLRIDKYTPVP